jgi:hypothetical protein
MQKFTEKKSLWAWAAAMLLSFGAAAQSFYYTNFDNLNNWTASDSRITLSNASVSSGYTASTTSPPASGGNNVRFNDCSPMGNTLSLTLAGAVNTTGKTGIRVGFGRRSSASWNGVMLFQWSADGSIWEDIDADASLGATTAWDTKYYDLPAGAENLSNLRFRFQYTTTESINCTAPPNFRIDDFIVGQNMNLPVHWLDFKVQAANRTSQLIWTTAEETDSDFFAVERSTDGFSYQPLASVKAVGNSRSPQTYTYTDPAPAKGTNYYRLRQVDTDGRWSYSPVVTALMDDAASVQIFPSSTADVLRLSASEPSAEDRIWQVFDPAGRLLQSGLWEAESVLEELNVSHLPQGWYTLRLSAGHQNPTVLRFQKM